ncbi:amidohydrolase family protein [Glutamicibacter sp. NPDC087344]|uniref:amidohydrolase family protein n=1 Tax=Glutamicibacter sp. NPDC087344 TaxID=3363994 RepID=UPI0037F9FA4E
MDYASRYAGISAAQLLHSATGMNARILGIAETTGALRPGLAADFVVLSENPLENLRSFEYPVMVCARGQLIEKPSVKRFADVDQVLDSL